MATITWTGAAGDDSFANAANWSPQQVPGAADTAVVKVTSALNLAVDQAVGQLVTSADVTLSVGGSSSLTIGNGGTATAVLTNAGTILLDGTQGDGLVLDQAQVTLSGAGHIQLVGQVITASAATDVLTNVNDVIAGSGSIGAGTLSLSNGAKGVIDANLKGTQLTVNTGTATASNTGQIEATAGGTLVLASAVSNASGTIAARGGTVLLAGGDIQGGTLTDTGSSVVQVSGTGTLDGTAHAVASTATIKVVDDTSLSLLGTIANGGAIRETDVDGAGILAGPASGAPGTVVLTGAGTISLNGALQAAQAGDVLDNTGNTINGQGSLGNGNLGLVNGTAGVIDANAAGNQLVLDTGTAASNAGLIEATAGGELTLASAVANAGTIAAAGGVVMLSGGSIAGGVLTDSAGGTVQVSTSGTLDGSAATVSSTAYVEVDDTSGLTLLGAISNAGTLHEDGVHGAGIVVGPAFGAAGTVTLTGGGTLALASALQGGQAGDTLVNTDNTITGYGQLGDGTLSLVNGTAGVIDAGAFSLLLNTGTAAVLNSGLFESTGNGGLYVLGQFDDGSTGTLAAAGGNVILQDGSVVAGGLITGSGTGSIVVSTSSTPVLLDGTSNAVTNTAHVQVTDYSGLTIAGTFFNEGFIEKDGVHGPGISISAGATLTNLGTLQAAGGYTVGGTAVMLTNDSAAGTLTGGDYQALGGTLSFQGTTVSTLGAGTTIDIGSNSDVQFGGSSIFKSVNSIAAGAALIVEGSATFTRHITNAGTLLLDGGTFKSTTFSLDAGAVLGGTGTFATTISGTQAITVGNGELDFTGPATTLSGTISGSASSTIGFGGTTTLSSGATLAIGHVAVLNGTTLHLGEHVSFAGTFDVRGQASLTGAGYANSGVFEQVGSGTATVAIPVASTGTIATMQGGTLAFTAGLGNGGVILDNGGLTDTAALTGGTLDIGAAGTASLGTTSGSGTADTLARLNMAGGTLNTNGATLTVTTDYNNTAAGTGNAYTPFAGVTGTIDDAGTGLAVVGVGGTTLTSSAGTYTLAIQAGSTASFEIENTGAAGSASLRGALQTTVNGGSISGTALTGSGVTAGNFAPLAVGAASGAYTIAYSGGGLSGEAIHIASDFANVPGVTVDIVAQAAPAVSRLAEHGLPSVWDLALLHH